MPVYKKGTAKIMDLDGFLDWYGQLDAKQAQAEYDRLGKIVKEHFPNGRDDYISPLLYHIFCLNSWASYPETETKEYKWERKKPAVIQEYKDFACFSSDFNQKINVGFWNDGIAFLFYGNPKEGVIFPDPARYLEYIPEKDYSDMTPAEVRQLYSVNGGQNLMKPEEERMLTPKGVKESLDGQESQIERLNQVIERVKRCETSELAEMKRQIEEMKTRLYEKKAALQEILEEKLEELEETKANLESQIFILDSQIYAIRCFAGETVRFTRIRSGKDAPDTEPVIIHQKLRFLDEDLAKLASIYSIEWEELGMFESFLKSSPLALETFAPNQRCIVLVRLSKNNVQLGSNSDVTWANLLKKYEYFHGSTVGIIIRNGENLYLGWTDEDRVHISDDLIMTQAQTDITPGGKYDLRFKSDQKQYVKDKRKMQKVVLDGIVSRAFVYNILEGIVEHSSILPLPDGVTLSKQSEYVKYAVADKWVSDTRFGSFTEIIERVNRNIQRGDKILIVQRLRPEYDRIWGSRAYGGTRPYENPRGRGEKNRTHDCSVEDCKIYPVNLVEYDDPVSMTRYRYKKQNLPGDGDQEDVWVESVMPTKSYEYNHKRGAGNPSDEVIEVYEYRRPHMFVSVPKEVWWGDTNSRANFEIYESEYINLTFLNSVWLEWAVNSKNLGNWKIGGEEVDYAYAIRYIKTALDYVRSREAEEKAFIDAIDPDVCSDPDWPVRLSEWKIEKNVHHISEYQAKRFVKSVK